MISQPGPPGPYGSPPPSPYGPPRRGNGAATLVAAVLAAAFVVATVIVAVVVHDHGTSAQPTATGGQYALGASAAQVTGSVPGVPAPGIPTPGVTGYATPTYTPPTYAVPTPTSTHVPLDPEAINRTFEVYMNALAYHSLSTLKTATCPRLRKTETGTALHGKYVGRWKGNSYRIYSDLDHATLSAHIQLLSPSTGRAAGTATYRWNVERDPSGHYYVCGFLS